MNSAVERLKGMSRVFQKESHRLDHAIQERFFKEGLIEIPLEEQGLYVEILAANPPKNKADIKPSGLRLPNDQVVPFFGGGNIHLHQLTHDQNRQPMPGELLGNYVIGLDKLPDGFEIIIDNGDTRNPKTT
jgi:hypothetical protein